MKLLARLALSIALLLTTALALDRIFPPDLSRYQERSTEIVDANGRLLRAFTTANGTWRLKTTVGDVDPTYLALLKAYEDRGYHQVALLDLLPAGFEIESVVNKDTVKNFSFLPNVTRTRMAEARDDRFFAAFDLGRQTYWSWWDDRAELDGGYRFHVAYIVRAVTPGSFALPAVNVSDMYAPRVYARTAMGHVTIAPR